MTQQVPAGGSESRFDEDLDALLRDDPDSDATAEEVAEEQRTPRPAATTAPPEPSVPLAQIDAMLADRVDDEAFGSIDDLLDQAGGQREREAAIPAHAGTLPSVTHERPLPPAPANAAASRGATENAVAAELDADQATHETPPQANLPKVANGPFLKPRRPHIQASIAPQAVVGALRRSCAMVNRPVRNLSPDMRSMVGYAGLVTIFTATLLLIGKITSVMMGLD